MDDSIVWKEARSHQTSSNRNDDEDDESNSQGSTSHPIENADRLGQSSDCEEDAVGWGEPEIGAASDTDEATAPSNAPSQGGAFSHRQINLKLRRNITALADQAQHRPKLEYVTGSQSFDRWVEAALIAISPSADIILFSGRSPERLVFIAKLRMEPINQYVTKALDIGLDYDEHITSLLCLPVMSTQRTALGTVDWTALVVGLSSGYVKFYTEQSTCLLSLKFCDEPVNGLKLQTQKSNSNARSQAHFASIVDELFISYKTCAIVTDGIGLFENLRIAKDDVVKSQFSYEPAYSAANLPTFLTCQRWKFQEGSQSSRVMDADLLGMRSTTKFDTLKSSSMNPDYVPSKALTRTLVLVGRHPFLMCQREARETATHSYTEMIGSLLPFWSKPQPSRVQINDITCSSSSCLYDKGRLATTVTPSPDRRLAVVTDDFGRVMLLDATNWLVVRVWKGYRNAQCGWVEVKRNPEERDTPYASFLIIYAPKRGLLEVWSTQRGPRVAAFNVGKGCRLLYAGHKMLNMRAESQGAQRQAKPNNLLVEQSYSNNCYLLNAKSETLFSIELPYTYSLYKYGDLKSRDRLLINELMHLLEQDADEGLIAETLQRMSLAESLELAIQRAASLLQPAKIIPIMESLIVRIMKNYDNHSGETMSADDQSVIELAKRLLRLCYMFTELSQSSPSSDMSLPDVNRRLIDDYDEHPREVDEFAEHLGWSASEVLRYLSLLALERSYRRDHVQNPWPNLGEPLAWAEFVSCFDLARLNLRTSIKGGNNRAPTELAPDKICIKLKGPTSSDKSKLVADERVLKTALFMYNRLSENFYKVTSNSSKMVVDYGARSIGDNYTYLDPSSRLVLLFHFWLSTKLCNHWKMWAFLQAQIGQMSDELKVIVMTHDSDELLIETWKRIYQLILESDNTYAAIIATAAIRSDTIRMISDNEKREKLARETSVSENSGASASASGATASAASAASEVDDDQKSSTIDWECLCVDAERMSMVSQQLEDVFLLNLLLRYAPIEGHLTDKFIYRVPRISVANVLRSGPTVVSELVAQWVAQANLHPKLFTQPYGLVEDATTTATLVMACSSPHASSRDRSGLFSMKSSNAAAAANNNEEHAKELLHHVKTSFPHSLEPDVVLLHCVWEFCQRWATSQSATARDQYLSKALDCLSLLATAVNLKHNSACLAYKTFFQRPFERLTALIETNPSILSPKCSRSRDALARRELNMSAECLEDFVQFCFKLSDFMLETSQNASISGGANNDKDGDGQQQQDAEAAAVAAELARERLLALDDWWSTTAAIKMLRHRQHQQQLDDGHSPASYEELRDMLSMDAQTKPPAASNIAAGQDRLSLVRAAVTGSASLFDISTLIELNRLAALMMLIFKLKLVKSFPLSLIGEESRQALRLDLQQSPATGADLKTRRGYLNELRQQFGRKCIVSIVLKLTDETNLFDDDNDGTSGTTGGGIFGRNFDESGGAKDGSLAGRGREDIDTNEKQSLASPDASGGGGGSSKSRGVKTTAEIGKQQQQIVDPKDGRAGGQQQARSLTISHRREVARPTEATSGTETSAGGGGIGSQFSEQEVEASRRRHRLGLAGTAAAARATDPDDDSDTNNLMTASSSSTSAENNESMILFTHLLSLAREWQFNCDELHLELVFELFRCNHDKLASQLANRVQDKQTLANGLLKISSQRVLALLGLSPSLSSSKQWRRRADKWSLFQPNVASWLKGIQEEESKHELADLMFQDHFKPPKPIKGSAGGSKRHESDVAGDFHAFLEDSLGLRLFVLNALRQRTQLILEMVTNYLDGQAGRLAYDLLQVLESDQLFEKFLRHERKLWLKVEGSGGEATAAHEHD